MSTILPKTMVPLSLIMYRGACHLAYLAKQKALIPENALPIATVGQAASALEAFLNEEFARIREVTPGWKDTFDALDGVETASK
jgi:hypothetical protein